MPATTISQMKHGGKIGQRDDAGGEGVELDAEFRQDEEDQEDLHQERRAADQVDPGADHRADDAVAVCPQDAEAKAEQRAQHQADQRQHDGHAETAQRQRITADEAMELLPDHVRLLTGRKPSQRSDSAASPLSP